MQISKCVNSDDSWSSVKTLKMTMFRYNKCLDGASSSSEGNLRYNIYNSAEVALCDVLPSSRRHNVTNTSRIRHECVTLRIRPGYLIFKKCDDPPAQCKCRPQEQASSTTPFPGEGLVFRARNEPSRRFHNYGEGSYYY